MTVLDQAFIKAYLQQGPGTGTASGEGPRAVPLSDALATTQTGPACTGVSAASALGVLPRSAGSPEPSSPAPASVETTARSAAHSVSPRAAAPGAADNPVPAPHFGRQRSRPAAPSVQDLGIVKPVHEDLGETLGVSARLEPSPKFDHPCVTHGERPKIDTIPCPAPATSPAGVLEESIEVEPAAENEPSAPEVLAADMPVASEVQPEETAGDVPETAHVPEESEKLKDKAEPVAQRGTGLEPQLQVDRFLWPRVCQRLSGTAGRALDELAHGLAAMAHRRGRVVAMTACRRGEGVTTLALCAAQRLARAGRRVVLVDADAGHAEMARRLGLLPEFGWEDVLCGRLPLNEVLVQSIDDRMTLLPLNDPAACCGRTRSQIVESLHQLREHYDLVLVNLPPLEDSPEADAWREIGLAETFDLAVLVRDMRSGADRGLDEACRPLRDEGLSQVAVVENFA